MYPAHQMFILIWIFSFISRIVSILSLFKSNNIDMNLVSISGNNIWVCVRLKDHQSGMLTIFVGSDLSGIIV